MSFSVNPITNGVELQIDGITHATLRTDGMAIPAATADGDAVRKDQTHITSETPCFSAYPSGVQGLTATTQKVSLQSEDWDTTNAFDSTTNYRFTPQVAGYYHITGTVQLASAQYMSPAIYKNGAGWKTGSAITSVIAPVDCLVYLNGTTDYIELFVYVGLVVNTVASGTRLQGVLVRAA